MSLINAIQVVKRFGGLMAVNKMDFQLEIHFIDGRQTAETFYYLNCIDK